MAQVVDEDGLAARIGALASQARARILVAIAGAPGSGKSTLAKRLAAAIPGAVVVPMDGFHYDNAVIEPLGLRPRKGSAPTFDAAGWVALMARLRAETGPVAVPVFDPKLDLARASARIVPPEARVILCEGNWLLLDEAPWTDVTYDLTVMVEADEPVLRQRLRARWEGHGLSEDEIVWKLDGNDLPNGRVVAEQSRATDLVIRSG